jgi:hypothetical protein
MGKAYLCADRPCSADATIASQATGAMSWAFISALKQNPQQSYVQLLNSIRDVLQTKYTQKPQLSCSHPLGGSFSPSLIASGFSRVLIAVNFTCR